MQEGEYKIRFRHQSGDMGPLYFSKDTTIAQVIRPGCHQETKLTLQVKERLIREWPSEGLIAPDVPNNSKEILLILGGKMIDDGKALFDYERDMGNFGPGHTLTVHLVTRKPQLAKNLKESNTNCCCCCCVQ